ncbi:MAG TPA: DUF1580 domain-containing protein [Urbifossiella sp.]
MSESTAIERITAEGPIGVSRAAREYGRHPATFVRWCIDGIRLPSGQTVRLEHYRLGNRLTTSRQSILRFIAAQQSDPVEPVTTPAARRRADAEAERVLDAAGII